MEALWKQRGNGTQLLDLAGLPEHAAAAPSPAGDIRLDEAGLGLALRDQLHVLDGALSRLGDRDEAGHAADAVPLAFGRAGRARDRARERAADLEIGAAG